MEYSDGNFLSRGTNGADNVKDSTTIRESSRVLAAAFSVESAEIGDTNS